MKTSKINVRNRFKKLWAGVLSAAMLLSAVSQIPVLANEKNGGYEVLYDFIKDGYTKSMNVFSDNGIDTISEGVHWQNATLASNALTEPVTYGNVRFHFEYMHEYTTRLPQWRVMANDTNAVFDYNRWYGLSEVMTNTNPDEFKIGYYNAKEDNINLIAADVATFEKGIWYSLDTIYDLTNGKVHYYINGEKIGTGDGPERLTAIGIRTNQMNISAGASHYRNMKLDIGTAAEIIDTSDSGAVLEFTQPINLNTSDIAGVKCLETGEEKAVTVTKINDMKYNVSYSTGENVGGDYMLTFSNVFAEMYEIAEKSIVYSQKPSASYTYYINDDFESYVPEDEFDNAWVSHFWTKNPEISQDKIRNASQEKSGYTNHAVYAIRDENNTMMKVDLSRCITGNAAKDWYVAYKYALDGFTTSSEYGYNPQGKIKLSFKVKNVDEPNEGVSSEANIFTVNTNPWTLPIIGINKDTLYVYGNGKSDYGGSDKLAKIHETFSLGTTTDGFHRIEMLFDYGNRNITVRADGTQRASFKMSDGVLGGISWLHFSQGKASEWTGTTDIYGKLYTLMDNLEVRDEAPILAGIKSVQYSTDGINYSPAVDKVDCETKYVKIDFTAAMKADTLTNINLSNGSTAVNMTGTPSNANKTYTLELTDKLAKSTNYTLNIPKSVKTEDGKSFARDYNGAITTTAGVFRVDLLDIQKDSNSVTTTNGIAAGESVNAVVKITNTEGREGEAYLCVCVYNDKVLKQIKFEKIDLSNETEKSIPITVQSIDKLKIKAFLWNNFEAMKPLIKNKTVE
ncbi:MAG: Ig-like domain-containing protein [Eubacteriales bacterium]|nr:Ig-like domain-containing protein [Eubacteriales bacterium]MDY4212739.1 Ig-like domain-containing protein [Eubacteriales bacterium]